MAVNYEFERHIREARAAQNPQGADFLDALRRQYNIAASIGLVPILEREPYGREAEKEVFVSPRVTLVVRGEGRAHIETEQGSIEHNFEIPDKFDREHRRAVHFDGGRLKLLRNEAKLKQKDVALYVGRGNPTISMLEQGKRVRVLPSVALRLCFLFGQNPSALIPDPDDARYLKQLAHEIFYALESPSTTGVHSNIVCKL